jgi:hypothetical protein
MQDGELVEEGGLADAARPEEVQDVELTMPSQSLHPSAQMEA